MPKEKPLTMEEVKEFCEKQGNPDNFCENVCWDCPLWNELCEMAPREYNFPKITKIIRSEKRKGMKK
jgi:hypothetical protein